jgi:hypothetical protein
MKRRSVRDSLGWGFLLWFVGYVLGFVFYAFVPRSLIGWAIMPIGVAITLWVLLRKIKAMQFQYYACLGIVWALIAIVCDYLFMVVLLKPPDGYYKLDVYLYYALTLVLPLLVGSLRARSASTVISSLGA